MALGLLNTSPKSELKTYCFWRDLVSEFVATLLLLFVVNATDCVLIPGDSVDLLTLGLTTGMSVFIYIEALGTFGGCHMNVAVTVLLVCTKHISPFKALLYIGVQCCGAAAGAGIVYLCINEHGQKAMGVIDLAPGVSQFQGIVIEAVITFSLCIVALGASNAKRQPRFLTSLAVGMAITVGIVSGGKISGGAMNPMISFGPSVVTGEWKNHWVYWVGPIIGALLAALFYNSYTLADRLDRKRQQDYPLSTPGGTDTKITGYDNKGMSDIAMSPMDNASNPSYVAVVD